MPHAQIWTCKECGHRQVLVFEGGAQGPRLAPSALLSCARCDAFHDVRLPPGADRESLRVGTVEDEPATPCPECAAPEFRVRSGPVALATCANGHARPWEGS
jgi:hypothetical protein